MKWDWNVFLKSLLFIFLGFLLGFVSAIIYLAENVDLSQLFTLSIITFFLLIMTCWYAYSTHRMLKEQEKTRKIEYLKYKLEKLYYPIHYSLKENSKINTLDYLPFGYLGTKKFIELFDVYFKADLGENISITEFQDATSNLMKVVDEDITNLKYELDELIQ